MSDQMGRGRAQSSGRWKVAGIAAGVLVLLALFGWQAYSRFTRPRPVSSTNSRQTYSMGKPYEATPVSAASVPRVEPAAKPDERLALKPAPAAAPWLPPKVQPMGFWQDPDSAGSAPSRPAATPVSAAAAPADPDVVTPGGGQSEYAQRMRTTPVANITPAFHRFHNDYTIKKGLEIPCTPWQPISSALPGDVRCFTTDDVWSINRATILLPKFTQINGRIERGLGLGDERLFLVWTDALTPGPDYLPIPLDGMPAADEAGQTGVPGALDTHIWQKLKATALVTLLQTGSSVAVAAAQSGRGNNYFSPVGQAGNGLAEQAFGRDLNIPTTLYRGPGKPLTVYVNKYVDLSAFYRNVPVVPSYPKKY